MTPEMSALSMYHMPR